MPIEFESSSLNIPEDGKYNFTETSWKARKYNNIRHSGEP